MISNLNKKNPQLFNTITIFKDLQHDAKILAIISPN
jgi:hypothetical protein